MNKIYIKTGEVNGVETGFILKGITIDAEIIVGGEDGKTQGGNTKITYIDKLKTLPLEMVQAVFEHLEPQMTEEDESEV